MQIVKKLKHSTCSLCREQKTLEESGLHQALTMCIMVFFEVAYSFWTLRLLRTIVIIRNWLGNSANFGKGTNKYQKIYVGRSTTLHNLLFCAHTLWLNYVTVTFLLVSSSGTNHDLLCLCRVMAKKANKNIEQRILPCFLTIYLY